MDACAKYPRPLDPAEYENAPNEGVNVLTDTFWCREKHLQLAEGNRRGQTPDPVLAALHCPAASPDGGYVCVNYQLRFDTGKTEEDEDGNEVRVLERATVWERQRTGFKSARRLGYCDMYEDDTIADCTKSGLDDVSLPQALSILPLSTRMIILNNNLGITTLGFRVFADNLIRPTVIEALIIDDGNIVSVDGAAFQGMPKLQIVSLNMQRIAAIPANLFAGVFELKEFSMKNTRDKPGLLTSIPASLFGSVIALQRLVISGHRALTGIPPTFLNGLPNVRSLDLSNNGFINSQLPNDEFDQLCLLESLDMSGNDITHVKIEWFGAQILGNLICEFDPLFACCLLELLGIGEWEQFTLRDIKFHDNPISRIDAGSFFFLLALNYVYLHDTNLINFPQGLFAFNYLLLTYTLRPL